MPYPDYGTLGHTFLISRFFQFVSLICLIGLSSRLISEFIEDSRSSSLLPQSPPPALIATLSISCLATLYIAGSTILYFESLLHLFAAAVLDTLFTIALLTTSIVLGKPLGYLSCKVVAEFGASHNAGSNGNMRTFNNGVHTTTTSSTTTSTITSPSTIHAPTTTLLRLLRRAAIPAPITTPHHDYDYDYDSSFDPRKNQPSVQSTSFTTWIGSTEQSCGMMKGVWGLAIALTILFLVSAFGVGVMWWKVRTVSKVEKLDGGEENEREKRGEV